MMKKTLIAGLLMGAICCGGSVRAAEMPQMPKPTKQHAWLQRFVGQWETKVTMPPMEPGKPPMQAKCKDTFRMIGGFWLQGEFQSEMMGQKFTSLLTVGFDPAKKRYTGTWIDSMGSYLWKYDGSVDASGNKLTLNTEGPCPMSGGAITKMREVTEFKGPNHRVFTSSFLNKGKWETAVTMESWRKTSRK